MWSKSFGQTFAFDPFSQENPQEPHSVAVVPKSVQQIPGTNLLMVRLRIGDVPGGPNLKRLAVLICERQEDGSGSFTNLDPSLPIESPDEFQEEVSEGSREPILIQQFEVDLPQDGGFYDVRVPVPWGWDKVILAAAGSTD